MFRQLRIVGLNLMPFNSGSKQEESVQLCRSKATLCFGCSFCKKKKIILKSCCPFPFLQLTEVDGAVYAYLTGPCSHRE